MNIFGNALKYTQKGSIVVKLALGPSNNDVMEDMERMLEIKVVDTGYVLLLLRRLFPFPTAFEEGSFPFMLHVSKILSQFVLRSNRFPFRFEFQSKRIFSRSLLHLKGIFPTCIAFEEDSFAIRSALKEIFPICIAFKEASFPIRIPFELRDLIQELHTPGPVS